VIIFSLSYTPWFQWITTERTTGRLGFVWSRQRLIYAGMVRSNNLHNPTFSATPVLCPCLVFPNSFEPSVALTCYFAFHLVFTSSRPLFPYRGHDLSLVSERPEREPRLCTARTSVGFFIDNGAVPLSHLLAGTRPANCGRLLANPYGRGALYQREGLEETVEEKPRRGEGSPHLAPMTSIITE